MPACPLWGCGQGRPSWAGARDEQAKVSFSEEAVNEVKRQAMSELQKAVSDAERKAHELISTERAKMERALAEGQQRGGQLQEQLTQQLSQALSSAVAGRLERSVRDEIKKTVPPCEFHMETSGQAIFEGPSPCQASSHGSTPPSFPCPRCLPESGARGWPAQQLGGHQTHSCGE